MARLPRYSIPGQPQHIIQRGNGRMAIFRSDDDYEVFIRYLLEAARGHGCSVHAYVLMTNHVHFLVTPERSDGVSLMMQSIGRSYVPYFNHTHHRSGGLWQGRYRAAIINSEQYLLRCCCYIDLNPVRAGLVDDPADYTWSSFRHHAHGEVDSVVSEHELFTALGNTGAERQTAYRDLCATALSHDFLQELRDATNRGWTMGDPEFMTKIEDATGRRAGPLAKGRPKKGSDPI